MASIRRAAGARKTSIQEVDRMTRIFLAILFAAGLSAPALAQSECGQEVNEIWAAVQQSQLEEDQKNQVGQVLQQAQMQEEQGDAEACMQTVDQVKVALGME